MACFAAFFPVFATCGERPFAWGLFLGCFDVSRCFWISEFLNLDPKFFLERRLRKALLFGIAGFSRCHRQILEFV